MEKKQVAQSHVTRPLLYAKSLDRTVERQLFIRYLCNADPGRAALQMNAALVQKKHERGPCERHQAITFAPVKQRAVGVSDKRLEQPEVARLPMVHSGVCCNHGTSSTVDELVRSPR